MMQRGYGQTMVDDQIKEAWNKIVGGPMSTMSRPGKIRQGVLDVFVSNSTANQELTFRRREIVKKLTEAIPQHSIKNLRLRVS